MGGRGHRGTTAACTRSCTLHRLLWAGAIRTSLGTFPLRAGEGVWHCTPYPCVTTLEGAEPRPHLPPVTICYYSRARCSQLTPHYVLWLCQELPAREWDCGPKNFTTTSATTMATATTTTSMATTTATAGSAPGRAWAATPGLRRFGGDGGVGAYHLLGPWTPGTR